MLYFCTSYNHRYVIDYLIKLCADKLQDRVTPVSYSWLYTQDRIPLVPFIFADLERQSGRSIEHALRYWTALSSEGVTVLNRPDRFLKRYDLLRKLHEMGINQHNIYRLNEDRSNIRFPVFVRVSDDHKGSETELIHNAEDLDREIDRVSRQHDPGSLVIIEYLDYRSEDGMYYKYSSYRIGDELVPAHLIVGHNWMLKTDEIVTPEILQLESDFLADTTRTDEILKIFDVAGVDYGRVDFCIVDGRVQVFEVNTAPTLGYPGPVGSPRYQRKKSVYGQVADKLLQVGSEAAGSNRFVTVPGPRLDGARRQHLSIVLTAKSKSIWQKLEPGRSGGLNWFQIFALRIYARVCHWLRTAVDKSLGPEHIF